ncbi:hypothetical protein BGZ61DRAFT_456957 [Ilyonectria robusta]|uniref:uncharacterized protein n=1 Tax=Ilyonectria robusta TaxID=1079257 RepID=UPI001E8D4414|nr:uncharacterized protein BGZ61DRAFT_456957 [Ilyonectria robusta]KAH8679247.1 hypothetical protein BGZ61DRAFT_456957 [Ilyonectria robusta]
MVYCTPDVCCRAIGFPPLASRLNLLTYGSRFIITLSAYSFVPQYNRIRSHGNCDGITSYYILFSLIVATEQFARMFAFIVAIDDREQCLIEAPSKAHDRLNLAQCTVLWLCNLFLFGLYLFYSSVGPVSKISMVLIYVAFLSSSVGPFMWLTTLPPSRSRDFYKSQPWRMCILKFMHGAIYNPIFTTMSIFGLLVQLLHTRSRSDLGALSIVGLRTQAVVFWILSILWRFFFRLSPVAGTVEWGPVFQSVSVAATYFAGWYRLIGWTATNSLVFAVGQGLISLAATGNI